MKARKKFKFRNYTPDTVELSEDALKKDVPLVPSVAVMEEIGGLKAKSLEKTKEIHLEPKKADWDLARTIEKQMKQLNRRTQRAIREVCF